MWEVSSPVFPVSEQRHWVRAEAARLSALHVVCFLLLVGQQPCWALPLNLPLCMFRVLSALVLFLSFCASKGKPTIFSECCASWVLCSIHRSWPLLQASQITPMTSNGKWKWHLLRQLWGGSVWAHLVKGHRCGSAFQGKKGNSSASRRFLTDQPSLTLMSHEKEPGLGSGHGEGGLLMVAGDRPDDKWTCPVKPWPSEKPVSSKKLREVPLKMCPS